MDERDLKATPMDEKEQASCTLYVCAAGHVLTKNDESWSGPCDVPECKEAPVAQAKADKVRLYERFYADRKAVEAEYEQLARAEPVDAKEDPVLDPDLEPEK